MKDDFIEVSPNRAALEEEISHPSAAPGRGPIKKLNIDEIRARNFGTMGRFPPPELFE